MAYCNWKSYRLKISPLYVFEALKEKKGLFFLDSSLVRAELGRYSFIGCDPFYVIRSQNEDPFRGLRKALNDYKITSLRNAPSFIGGAVGCLGYDLGFLLEKKLRKLKPDDLLLPEAYFAFYNTVIVFDSLKKAVHIFSSGFPEKKHSLGKALAERNLRNTAKLLSNLSLGGSGSILNSPSSTSVPKSDFSRKAYVSAVKRAKEYIKSGDIYQVNLAQRFTASTRLSPNDLYKRLRVLSPSFFSAYLDCQDFQVLSSSPERFLSLKGRKVITRPMKGTRKRGENNREDALLKKALLASPKDKAELTMIVDLERNDLGKVCDYHSIKASSLRELEKYSTVYQTTATVEGLLYKNKDRVDLLRACFPGGSITGCPKLRSMEIIEELEPSRRSLYTGSLGYLSFSGEMDFNILIRTIVKKNNALYFGVGSGIVADSDPESEYEETMIKAKAMMQAIG